MIAGLRGKIQRIGATRVYLDVTGVVYEIHVPLNVQAALKAGRESVFLHIYHHFTDQEQRLYGFLDATQRDFFIALQNIKGLGTALALSILSHLEGAQLLELCARKDSAALTRIPRVGKTTAETIIFEVNRRRQKWEKVLNISMDAGLGRPADGFSDEMELAYQALLQLGYRDKEARAVLERLEMDM
ncbi:MAG: Holliday junction branch migration protein RuvA, partial [Leptospiraceae bacterium]|nr:Holliday junction branch migration protein RuvA [Leptospiraceae bacterium]